MALKYIRDNLKSLYWVLYLVLFALVALIFFEWGGYNRGGSADNQVAATVGSEEITYGEFQQAYRNLEDYYRNVFKDQFNRDLAQQLNLPRQALDQLINRRILLMEAESAGLQVTDEEVREVIVDHPAFQKDGRFVGIEEYEKILRRGRVAVDDFHSDIRQDLLIQKLDTVLAATAYVPEAEVEKAYREQVERAKIRYLQLPAAKMGEIEVERADLEAHLEAHGQDFEIPEQRRVDYLLVDTIKLRQEIEIPEESIRAYYDENQEQYTRQEQVRARHILRKVTPERSADVARAEIEDLRRRIEAGKDFAALAREQSEDEVSAASGGTLRPFGRGEMVPPFEEAAFAAAAGELVGPVETSFGFHLIEKQAQIEGGVQPFEQVQPSIRARLLNEEANSMAESKALDLASRITAEMTDDELAALAEEEGLAVETTEPFDIDGTVTGIGRAPGFNQAAFDLEVGGISEPIRIPRGWAVVKLREILEPRTPELDEIEAELRQAVESELQREAALARLAAAMAADQDLEMLAGELELEVQESAEFGRGGSIPALGSVDEVIETALALDAGDTGGPFATEAGAVIFEVLERTAFDPVEFEAAKETTRAEQEGQRVEDLKRSLIEQRKRQLEPTYSRFVLENFGFEAPT